MQESRFTTLTRRGLMLPAEIREEIRNTGIRCRPQVEIVRQDRANQWKLRAEESGGAVSLLGHYVGFVAAAEVLWRGSIVCTACCRMAHTRLWWRANWSGLRCFAMSTPTIC